MKWLNSRQRITTDEDPAIGRTFLTPTQNAMRQDAKSRNGVFANDPTRQNMHPVSHVKVHADGTLDVVGLEADDDGWFDMGGRGAQDFAAGR